MILDIGGAIKIVQYLKRFAAVLICYINSIHLFSSNDLMEMIAALEIKSSHPVASAIVNHYSGCITDKITNFGAGVGLPDVFDFTSTPGLGLSGQVNGHVVAVGNMQILRQKIAEVSTEADGVYNEWSSGGQTVIFVTIDTKVSLSI